jgi:hypothetical protein
MKKFFITIAAALTLISTTAFAATGGDNPAETTFQKEFQGASEVKWTKTKETISADFVLGNSRIVAYFNYNGELLGTARNVLFNQLPLNVIREINNRYGSMPVYDITEFSVGGETFYRMDVETPAKDLKLHVTSAGDISVLQRIKK